MSKLSEKDKRNSTKTCHYSALSCQNFCTAPPCGSKQTQASSRAAPHFNISSEKNKNKNKLAHTPNMLPRQRVTKIHVKTGKGQTIDLMNIESLVSVKSNQLRSGLQKVCFIFQKRALKRHQLQIT